MPVKIKAVHPASCGRRALAVKAGAAVPAAGCRLSGTGARDWYGRERSIGKTLQKIEFYMCSERKNIILTESPVLSRSSCWDLMSDTGTYYLVLARCWRGAGEVRGVKC